MLRVLVIDDDPLVCDTMKIALEEYNSAEVVCCTSGAKAKELMRSMRFDAALIDGFLPGISGLELAGHAADLNIPILVTTGHPEVVLRCQKHGIPLLAKPFLPTNLSEEVIKVIRTSHENIAQVRAVLADLREAANGVGNPSR